MKSIRITALSLLLLITGIQADETIATVTLDSWGIARNRKVAFLDYHYATSTLFWGQVSVVDLATKASTIAAPATGTYPYFISFGFTGSHVAYIPQTGSGSGGGGGGGGCSGGRTAYLYDKNLVDGSVRQLTTSIAWKELVWAGGDYAVWVDYRHMDTATLDSINSEIYCARFSSLAETRLTTDHAFQHKPATDGRRVVWIDYTLPYGRLFMRDLETGSTTEIAPFAAGKDDPRVEGSLITWTDYRNPSSARDAQIYLYQTTSNSVTPICAHGGFQGRSYVSPSWIVWEDYRNATPTDTGNCDIYGYSIAAGEEIPLIVAPGYQGHPTLTNDTLFWIDGAVSPLTLKTKPLQSVTVQNQSRHSHSRSKIAPTRGDIRFTGLTPHTVYRVRRVMTNGRTVGTTSIIADANGAARLQSNNPPIPGCSTFMVDSPTGRAVLTKRVIQ